MRPDDISDMVRYFIREWKEVTKEEYVSAERNAGFRNTNGEPNEPATNSWSGGGVEGRQRRTKPE